MHRILIAPSDVDGETLRVTNPQEVHHLRRVLRLNVGDQIACLDGQGATYTGPILRVSIREVVVKIATRAVDARPSVQLTLAQSLIQPERFEWALEKSTELGVSRVMPLVTERVVARMVAASLERKMERWRRIMREAAKQCGQAAVPSLDAPCAFSEAVSALARSGAIFMPTLAVPTTPLAGHLGALSNTASVAVFIGPEGDFSDREASLAQAAGARLVSLGPLTLRSETAAITTLAILRHTLVNPA